MATRARREDGRNFGSRVATTPGPACAADAIKIGVIYPLTGNAASAGSSAKDAVELGAEIVNTARPELQGLPLAATAGLPNLGGAKIEPH